MNIWRDDSASPRYWVRADGQVCLVREGEDAPPKAELPRDQDIPFWEKDRMGSSPLRLRRR
jgi:hypothetical protein